MEAKTKVTINYIGFIKNLLKILTFNKMICNVSCLEKESAYDPFSAIMLATKRKRKHFNTGPKEKPLVFFSLSLVR